MTTTALRLSYVRAVDATLAASPRRLSDRTSWADMDWGWCGQGGRGRQKAVFRSFHAMLRPLRGHLCITYHLNPRQTLQHQPDCAPQTPLGEFRTAVDRGRQKRGLHRFDWHNPPHRSSPSHC